MVFLQIYKATLKRSVAVILLLMGSLSIYAQGIRVSAYTDTLRRVYELRLEKFPQPVSSFAYHTYAIPADLYAQHLPFFCREELRMKDAHVPVSFRLGTVEQCDYLEKKKSEP